MQCPTCNSDNVTRFSVLYDAGTSDINTTSYGSTSGYSYNGGFFTGYSNARTTGISQTRMAQRTAPPTKRTYGKVVLLAIVGIILLYWNSDSYSFTPGWTYIGIVLLVLAALIGYIVRDYNTTIWPRKYTTWEHSWHCNRCGATYVD